MTAYINKIKEEHKNFIFTKHGVSGMAVGKKETDGTQTNIDSIKIYVEKKEPLDILIEKYGQDAIIPKTLSGIRTDVVECGVLKAFAYDTKVRPIQAGYSVGHVNITAGTIGGVFANNNDEIVILSNNHVLANGYFAKVCDLCTQPGPIDNPPAIFQGWTRPIILLDYIGNLLDWNVLGGAGNVHDSAVVKLHPDLVASASYRTALPDSILKFNGVVEATLGMNVAKYGRTSEYTTGTVTALHGVFNVDYGVEGIKGFIECIATTAMSEPGDSGSIVYTTEESLISGNTRPTVGLLFAGSESMTLLNPMQPIITRYGLRFI